MSGLRAPVVSGIGGGVATTTLAVALRAHDAGRVAAETADILACRGTLDSLRRVAAVLERLRVPSAGAPPVLAVTLDGARLPRGPVRARLELLDASAGAVVLLPHVPRWRTIADPLPEAAQLLVEPAERLPRPLRAYAAALRELAAAVAASGRLQSGPEPAHRTSAAGPAATRSPGSGPRNPIPAPTVAPRLPLPSRSAPPAGPTLPTGDRVTGEVPRVVGTFRPVVGSVSPAPAPAGAPPGTTEPVRRPRGVRIVPAAPRRPVSSDRIEQVG